MDKKVFAKRKPAANPPKIATCDCRPKFSMPIVLSTEKVLSPGLLDAIPEIEREKLTVLRLLSGNLALLFVTGTGYVIYNLCQFVKGLF